MVPRIAGLLRMKRTPAKISSGRRSASRCLPLVRMKPVQYRADQPEHGNDEIRQARRNDIDESAERGPGDGGDLRRAGRDRGARCTEPFGTISGSIAALAGLSNAP